MTPEQRPSPSRLRKRRLGSTTICQVFLGGADSLEVCPFCQSRSVPATEPAFQSREVTSNSRLVDLLLLSEEKFREKFKLSPVKRAKRRGLLRDVAVALAASDYPKAEQALEKTLDHPESKRDCRLRQ